MNFGKLRTPMLRTMAGVMIALPFAASAGINFDPDGSGGSNASALNSKWVLSNVSVLAQNAIAPDSAGNFVETGVPDSIAGVVPRLLVQGSLTSTEFEGNTASQDPDALRKIAFELSVPVVAFVDAMSDGTGSVTGAKVLASAAEVPALFGSYDRNNIGSEVRFVNATSNLDVVFADSLNYFRIYEDPAFDSACGDGDCNPLDGDFGSGTPILEGKVKLDESPDIAVDPGSTTNKVSINSAAGPADLGENSQADALEFAGSIGFVVNVCTAEEAAKTFAEDPMCGKEDATAVSAYSEDHFPNTFFDEIVFNLDLQGQLRSIFHEEETVVPDGVVGETPDLGGTGFDTDCVTSDTCDPAGTNNFGLNDFKTNGEAAPKDLIMVSGSANIQWDALTVPEPATVALLGMALVVTGGVSRRREKLSRV